MGALGHHLESEGVPTTQISLIRSHTERIRPPRALWVPFDLGRPFGEPGDAALQTRVLVAALRLLEAPAGPVLEDFPQPDPPPGSGAAPWSCPLPLAPAAQAGDDLVSGFRRELAQLLPWFELARQRRGYTAFGVSELEPAALAQLLPAFLDAVPAEGPRADLQPGRLLKLAADDLRALYNEAATAQPAPRAPSAEEIEDWFWEETRAGALLRELQRRLRDSPDRGLALVADYLLVPDERASD